MANLDRGSSWLLVNRGGVEPVETGASWRLSMERCRMGRDYASAFCALHSPLLATEVMGHTQCGAIVGATGTYLANQGKAQMKPGAVGERTVVDCTG